MALDSNSSGNGISQKFDAIWEELRKIKRECKTKEERYESLRQAHNKQVSRFEEAKLRIEKQAQELTLKSDEISRLKLIYDGLKLTVNEKDSMFKHLHSANEKLLADYGERFQKLESENKELALGLEEARRRILVLESKTSSGNDKAECSNRLSPNILKRGLEADQICVPFENLKKRYKTTLQLGEQNRLFEEQFLSFMESLDNSLHDFLKASAEAGETVLATNLDNRARSSETIQTRFKHVVAHEDNSVVVTPIYAILGSIVCSKPQLTFTSNYVKLECSRLSNYSLSNFEWQVPDIIRIELLWVNRHVTARLEIHPKPTDTKETIDDKIPGILVLKVAASHHNWHEVEDDIKALNVRYSEIWNA